MGGLPRVIHQKMSPAVCRATWCARRSGGRGFSEAAAGPSPAPHAEFLIDRQGYLRAIAAASDDATRDPNLLVAEVQQLNTEKTPPPPPAEHVH